MKAKKISVLILIMALTCSLYAQSDKNKTNEPRENIFFESLTYPSVDSQDSNTVYFFYKIRLSELGFDKSDVIKLISFSAFPIIEIEIKDNSGIIRKRIFKKDTITVEDYSLLNKIGEYYNGFFKVRLSKIDYVVRCQVTDNNRDIYLKQINLENSTKNNFNIVGGPLLVNLLSGNESNYMPSVYNNSFDLKLNNPYCLLFTNPSNKRNLTASVTCIQETGFLTDSYPKTLNAEVVCLENTGIDFSLNNNSIKGSLNTNNNSTMYQIQIPQKMIYPGNFELSIIDGSKKDTLRYIYKVQWMDMPRTLVKISNTQDIMYYIMNDSAFAKLKSLREKDKKSYIYKFWQTKDPTPGTFYNEAMYEYFKRADEAKTKFSTILHTDGALTPRGQIYILYGNPDSITNVLKEKKPFENWQYSKLKKQFIFEIITPGDYKLVEVKE